MRLISMMVTVKQLRQIKVNDDEFGMMSYDPSYEILLLVRAVLLILMVIMEF